MARLTLTFGQRVEIARERARGVAAHELAERFGISRQTVHAVVRQLKDAPSVEGEGTRTFGVRVTHRDLRRFDVAVARHNLSRAEAIRRLMHAVDDVFVGDEDEADRIRQLGVALNRIGTNVNQIAKACNEARLKGQPIPYTVQVHGQVREALALAFEVADQVRQVADGRRRTVQAVTSAALQGGGHGTA